MTVCKPADHPAPLPERFTVSVIMQKGPSASAWSEANWEALGIAVTKNLDKTNLHRPRKIHAEADLEHYLYPNYDIRLYVDECESYYHNIISSHPRCYVVAVPDERDVPIPFLVSLSFDEANAYLECDEIVYAVDMPQALYRWTERFVLSNYVPEKKKKRRRNNWKGEKAIPLHTSRKD